MQRDAKGRFLKSRVHKFKVGDKVETIAVNDAGPGEVIEIMHDGTACKVKFATWYGICTETVKSLRKIEDAIPARVDIPLLIFERDGLFEEVARLKAQVKDRVQVYARKVQEAKEATATATVRAETAEAKLSDLTAIVRCMELAKASTVEEWDFLTLTQDVLGRNNK